MKLFSRIMVVLMALVLVLGMSVASAAPAKISEIEGLPECPEVPTMKVKTVKGTTTITMSEPLTWLNVINNWTWLDIIQWDEDKLVGTYTTEGLTSAVGTGKYMGRWDAGSWETGATQPVATDTDLTPAEAFDKYDGGYTRSIFTWVFDEETGEYKEIQSMAGMYSGWYDMGFGYDGGIADGSDVKYTPSGRVYSITVTKTGVNYLGGEKEPVKSEVTFKSLYGRMYVASIKETYDDDSTLEAVFSFNGDRIQLH